jgi:ribose transport system permease protein
MTTIDPPLPRRRLVFHAGRVAALRHPLLPVLVLLVVVFQASTGSFLDPGNLRGIALDAAAIAIVAAPLALLIISGYLDL